MGDVRGPRLIKRYANRKLYDLAERRYVTLEELQTLVARGVDVAADSRSGRGLSDERHLVIAIDTDLSRWRRFCHNPGMRLRDSCCDELSTEWEGSLAPG